MAEYENGSETRNRILDACVTLFTDKGYTRTTYADICTLAHVNQGSIYYHFKKKSELYRLAYERVNEVNYRIAQKLCDGEAAYLPFLLDTFIYWYRYFSEPSFRQFMADGLAISSALPPELTTDRRYWGSYWSRCASFIPDWESFSREHGLELELCSSIDATLTTHFQSGTEDRSFRAVATMELRYYADIFHMRQEHYELAMRRVNQILDQSLFSQLPELLRKTRLEL